MWLEEVSGSHRIPAECYECRRGLSKSTGASGDRAEPEERQQRQSLCLRLLADLLLLFGAYEHF